jgi:hypothetical protein
MHATTATRRAGFGVCGAASKAEAQASALRSSSSVTDSCAYFLK